MGLGRRVPYPRLCAGMCGAAKNQEITIATEPNLSHHAHAEPWAWHPASPFCLSPRAKLPGPPTQSRGRGTGPRKKPISKTPKDENAKDRFSCFHRFVVSWFGFFAPLYHQECSRGRSTAP